MVHSNRASRCDRETKRGGLRARKKNGRCLRRTQSDKEPANRIRYFGFQCLASPFEKWFVNMPSSRTNLTQPGLYFVVFLVQPWVTFYNKNIIVRRLRVILILSSVKPLLGPKKKRHPVILSHFKWQYGSRSPR